ncbi:MAG TPA: hypothetical protein VIU93_02585 [Gallionellaceae bacterium]
MAINRIETFQEEETIAKVADHAAKSGISFDAALAEMIEVAHTVFEANEADSEGHHTGL